MRSTARGAVIPVVASAASGTQATLLDARPRTEDSGLCFSDPSRDAGPSERATLGGREPAPRLTGDPTPPRGINVIDAPSTPSTAAESHGPPSAYERYADVFSCVYADARSIAIALEVLDTYRAREALARPADQDLPKRAIATAASLFHVPAKRLLERNRRTDVTSARYVAAWVLRRRRWSHAKIAEIFGLDHSTIVHGIRKVATTNHLLHMALKIEQAVDAANARF